MSSSSCPVCGASNNNTTTCPLASDWGDEDRMAFLMSSVSPDDSNARDQMIIFWSKAVAHAFENNASGFSLDPALLAKSALAWSASGMELAMGHMLSAGKLLPRGTIEAEAGLFRQLLVTPLVYLMGMVGLGTGEGAIPSGQYVHRAVMDAAAETVVAYCERLPEDERTVYLRADCAKHVVADPAGEASPWSFQQLCRAAGAAKAAADAASANTMLSKLSSDDYALLAAYLVRTKRAVREDGVLKVLEGGGGGGSSGKGTAAISETDKDLLRLRCTVASLQANALNLGRCIKRCRADALRENKQGQRGAALVHMRRMKRFQAVRDNRLASLFTLETALDQVKQLRVDKQVLQAHEAATHALKTCREAQGLTVERVEDTLDALAEEMAEHQAIGSALALESTLLPDDGDERAELEAELAELLKADSAAPVDTPGSVGDSVAVAAAGDPKSKPPIGGAESRPVKDATEATASDGGDVAVAT